VIDLRMNTVVNTFCNENFRVGVDSLRAVFSGDGQYVCAGATNGSVFVWNMKGKLETTLKQHS
jgi:autophagy-related protein 16